MTTGWNEVAWNEVTVIPTGSPFTFSAVFDCLPQNFIAFFLLSVF